MGTTLGTPEEIKLFQLHALNKAIALERLGMYRRGKSACQIVREMLGLKNGTSREYVQNELIKHIEEVSRCSTT